VAVTSGGRLAGAKCQLVGCFTGTYPKRLDPGPADPGEVLSGGRLPARR
jgi:hypothetical protein